MTEPEDTTRITLRDRLAAARWASRFVGALALVVGMMLLAERAILTHADAEWAQVDGFPAAQVFAIGETSGAIVHIGDSVVETAIQDEPERRTIPVIVGAEIHDTVRMVTRGATAADLHDAWLNVLIGMAEPPRAVIVAVNPRSFSPHWYRNPSWHFEHEAAAVVHPLFARGASALDWDWGRPTDEEYRATPVHVAGRTIGTLEALERPETGYAPPPGVARTRYVVRYAADYRESPRLPELRRLVRDANRAPFPVILYLTPIDVDQARSNMTPFEQAAMAANLRLLRAELARSRWPHADLTESVRTPAFDHPSMDPHEHLRAVGRLIVAQELVRLLRRSGAVEEDTPAR